METAVTNRSAEPSELGNGDPQIALATCRRLLIAIINDYGEGDCLCGGYLSRQPDPNVNERHYPGCEWAEARDLVDSWA